MDAKIISTYILTLDGYRFSESAKLITIPGGDGEFGVMAGHMPYASSIRKGIIKIDTPDGLRKFFSTSGGFAHIYSSFCELLLNSCEEIFA